LLVSHGHDVVRYTVHNDAIAGMNRWAVARRALSNPQTHDALSTILRQARPDLMHCTNTFPLISPAAYDAARAAGVTVVQALHNYRLVCPSAFLVRQGRVCEDCVGKVFAWPGIVHRCYRNSAMASSVIASMVAWHRFKGTWMRAVDLYYTVSAFARTKLIQGGLPADKIVVKPNFVEPDPGAGSGRGDYAVFVGRLSPEKGLETLLAAWELLSAQGYPLNLKIVGDGPLAASVKSAAERNPLVEWLGARSFRETLALVGEATMLVMPSVGYETFGRTIIESYAAGTPVIASNLGAMAELVEEGRTGLLFKAGDAADLRAKVRNLASNPSRLPSMRRAARHEFETKYTAEANYPLLMEIYSQAMANRASGSANRPGHAEGRSPFALASEKGIVS
jgi:glycosyltransferase involved in cell wall biosynthesis